MKFEFSLPRNTKLMTGNIKQIKLKLLSALELLLIGIHR